MKNIFLSLLSVAILATFNMPASATLNYNPSDSIFNKSHEIQNISMGNASTDRYSENIATACINTSMDDQPYNVIMVGDGSYKSEQQNPLRSRQSTDISISSTDAKLASTYGSGCSH